jgi:hypothetical protein
MKEGDKIVWKTLEEIGAGDGNTVTTITNDDGSITVQPIKDTDAEKEYDVKVNISEEEGNSLTLKDDGLYVPTPVIPDVPEYTIKELTPTTGSLKTYELQKDGASVAEKIEVVKDPRLAGITDDSTVVDYVATEIAKAEVAAMEFMGATTTLPQLKPEDKGHFYKVSSDISLDNFVRDINVVKEFTADNKVIYLYDVADFSKWDSIDGPNDIGDAVSGRYIPAVSCDKKVKVEVLHTYAIGSDWIVEPEY